MLFFTQLYLRVGILHVEKNIHERNISLRKEFWVHKTSLTRHFLLKCMYQYKKMIGHIFMC
jgi:hypothetical protein